MGLSDNEHRRLEELFIRIKYYRSRYPNVMQTADVALDEIDILEASFNALIQRCSAIYAEEHAILVSIKKTRAERLVREEETARYQNNTTT